MAAHAPPATPRRAGAAGRGGPPAWVFLLPPAVYLAAFVAVPAVLTVLAAFSVTDGGAGARSGAGTGAVTAVLRSAAFWRALGTTLLVAGIAAVLAVTFGTLLAHLLRARFRGRWAVRFAVVLPWATPVALSATSWRWLLGGPGSPAGRVLRGTGLLAAGTSWDARPALATAAVTAVDAWRLTPLATVIVLAGLAAIPDDVRDAARLDGAGAWRRAFGVTIPLTLPATGLAALVTALAGATGMTVMYVLTRGGPDGATRTLPALSYLTGVDGGATARGAAIAVLLLPVPLGLLAAWSRLRRRLVPGPRRSRARPRRAARRPVRPPGDTGAGPGRAARGERGGPAGGTGRAGGSGRKKDTPPRARRKGGGRRRDGGSGATPPGAGR